MNRTLRRALLTAFLFLFSTAHSQNFPTPFKQSFSSAGSVATQFDFDVPDTIFYDSAAVHAVIYRDLSETTWNNALMTLLYQTCTTYTYSATISYTPPGGVMEWYLRSENDTAVVSQSPKNSSNTFPVPTYLMTDMGADPAGDTVSALGRWLDVRGLYAGYSDTRLYFQFINDGGGYPTSSGLTTFFVYSVGVVDPDITNSVAYAAVYANVPLLLSPGLYRINITDTSFTRIANIQTSISGTALNIAVNIADLTADPFWTTWPPPSGFVGVAPLTATQTLTSLTPNDLGKAGAFLPSSRLLNFADNHAPLLSADSVAKVNSSAVRAQVIFSDADSNTAVLRNLHFAGSDYSMTACNKDYFAGTLFEREFTLDSSGWLSYYFQFSDGVQTVTTPVDSIFLQTYVSGDANGNGIVNIADVVYLLAYIFSNGPAPTPLEAGDASCNGMVNIADVVYLINYIFSSGPAPC